MATGGIDWLSIYQMVNGASAALSAARHHLKPSGMACRGKRNLRVLPCQARNNVSMAGRRAHMAFGEARRRPAREPAANALPIIGRQKNRRPCLLARRRVTARVGVASNNVSALCGDGEKQRQAA